MTAFVRQGFSRMGAAAWIPVRDGERQIGLLSVAFPDAIDDWGMRVTALEILASETAVAVQRQALMRRLASEAMTDGLTGAGNRRAWDAGVADSLLQARRTGTELAVVLLDLDHFKQFNDDHGHLAGDDHLRACAKAWTARLRPGDQLCRWGGEEFSVLLPACSLAGARQVADALRALVPEGETASAGIAVWDGQESAEALIARADGALYAAKAGGRDRTEAANG
jgi:diguanylate cyclase (GGDEF)-like protein